MMLKNTQDQIRKAAEAAGGKKKVINAEKLYQQKPTFYSFKKVFGDEKDPDNSFRDQKERINDINKKKMKGDVINKS